MPVNVPATSHGAAPAVVLAQEPSSPRGQSRVAPQDSSAAELQSRKALGGESPRPAGVGRLPGLPARALKQIADRLPASDVAPPPPAERNELTTHPSGMLDGAATPEARLGVARYLHAAAQGLDSPAQAEMLALIATRIDRMSAEARAELFSQITQSAMTRLSKADMLAPLLALGGQLEAFPVAQRFNVMAVLAFQNRNSPNAELRGLSLDPAAQAQLLAKLPEGIPSMGDEQQRLKAFNFLVGDILTALPADGSRLPALEALSRQLHELPRDEQVGSLWQLRCEIKTVAADPLFADRLALRLAGDLPLSDRDRAALLSSIIDQSTALPEQQRLALHREVHQMIRSAQLF